MGALKMRRRQDIKKVVGTSMTVALESDNVPLYLQECSQCRIIVPAKVANLTVDTCSDCEIEISGVIGSIEIVHSADIKLTNTQGVFRTVTVDMSADVTISAHGDVFPFKVLAAQCQGVKVCSLGSEAGAGAGAVPDALLFGDDGNPVQFRYEVELKEGQIEVSPTE
eukprot:JZ553920.1.p1 GENE.JZ553920.1~~JZ553920.1.p1  ORF type:complete len:182 (+),score=33.42 JZ553920.1:48-548(+)